MYQIEEQNSQELLLVIKEKQITPVFQPIVSLKTGEVFAYEALSRITRKDSALSIGEMFEMAEQMGCLWRLEKLCRRLALKEAINKPKGKKLFLNVDANVMQDSDFVSGFTREYLRKHKIKAEDVVFEITERSNVDDYELLQKVMQHYEKQGFEIALDDVGSGYSGLNRINYLHPKYIKLDIELIRNIQNSKSQKSLVGMLVRHCKEMKYALIAEGIETKEELQCLIELGVPYGQGFYLAKPEALFGTVREKVVQEICKCYEKKSEDKSHKSIGSLCKMGMVVYPQCKVTRACKLFLQDPRLGYISVVDGKSHFHGLIMRDAILGGNASEKPFDDKTIVEDMMESDIVTLDRTDSYKSAIGKLMTRTPEKVYEPFAVLRDGRYYGTATIRDLLIGIGKKLEE